MSITRYRFDYRGDPVADPSGNWCKASDAECAIARAEKAEASAERLAAEVKAWRHAMRLFDGTGYAEALGVVQETIAFREAVDAAGDLKETKR